MTQAVPSRNRPHFVPSALSLAIGLGMPFLACWAATGDASLPVMFNRLLTSPHPLMVAYALPCMVIATIAVFAQMLAWVGHAFGVDESYVLIYDAQMGLFHGGLAFFVALLLCGLSFGVFFVGMQG